MKKIFSLAVIVIIAVNYSVAQECIFYYPKTKDATLEYKSYDQKDKLTGISRQKIKDVTVSGDNVSAVIEAKYFDKDEKETYKNEFNVKCENGVFYIDMKNFMNPETMAAYKDMEMAIESSDLQMPSSLKAGDALGDGSITITISNQGMKMMTMATTITNRKVEAKENITTGAGTYECYKITSDILTKAGFMNVKGKSVEWYSKNVGVVKTESYSSNGKLVGYTLLTSLK